MDQIIKNRMESIDDALDRPSLDTEVKISINDLLRNVRTARNYILGADSYESFTLSYLKREAAKFRGQTDTHPNIDGKRDDPLCHCTDADCPLKHGELPVTVRDADSLSEGVLQFKRSHAGYPAVLDEVYREWTEMYQIVEDALTLASIAADAGCCVDDLPTEVIDKQTDEVDDVSEIDAIDPVPV